MRDAEANDLILHFMETFVRIEGEVLYITSDYQFSEDEDRGEIAFEANMETLGGERITRNIYNYSDIEPIPTVPFVAKVDGDYFVILDAAQNREASYKKSICCSNTLMLTLPSTYAEGAPISLTSRRAARPSKDGLRRALANALPYPVVWAYESRRRGDASVRTEPDTQNHHIRHGRPTDNNTEFYTAKNVLGGLKFPNIFVGVEVEVENSGLDYNILDLNDYLQSWLLVREPSLRGRDSVEYTFAQPLRGDDALFALIELDKHLTSYRKGSRGTSNCGVHVHVDITDTTLLEYYLSCMLYAYYEDYFFIGTGRESNNYCLPWRNSPPQIRKLFAGIIGQQDSGTPRGRKYLSCNAFNPDRFGTIEFRHFNSSWRKSVLCKIINDVCTIKELGKIAARDYAEHKNFTQALTVATYTGEGTYQLNLTDAEHQAKLLYCNYLNGGNL